MHILCIKSQDWTCSFGVLLTEFFMFCLGFSLYDYETNISIFIYSKLTFAWKFVTALDEKGRLTFCLLLKKGVKVHTTLFVSFSFAINLPLIMVHVLAWILGYCFPVALMVCFLCLYMKTCLFAVCSLFCFLGFATALVTPFIVLHLNFSVRTNRSF